MSASGFIWAPPSVPSLPVQGHVERLPVNRLFFVGRNYHKHAIEVGKPVDKTVDQPFYFTKSPSALVQSGATIAYPPQTAVYYHEIELVVAIGAPGFRVDPASAHAIVYGYACGLDMTRRDVQLVLREKALPWDLGKDVEQSAVVSTIRPMPGKILEAGEISLSVNGQLRQKSDLNDLIWGVRELIADLSRFYHLAPGDLIFTGTPEGVGTVVSGDTLRGHISGVGGIDVEIGSPSPT